MTGKERRHLRALAHRLSPVVIVGQRGLSDGVVRQVDTALTDHELIKVRMGNDCPAHRDDVGAELCARMGCTLAGAIGRIVILYRPHPERPKIVLPGPPDPQSHPCPSTNA